MPLTREVDPGLLAVLADHFHPAVLVRADHPDGMVRLHSGAGTMTWDSASWLPTVSLSGGRVVALVQFAGPEEVGGLATADATIKVLATVEAMLGEIGKAVRNRRVDVWFGAVTQAAGATLIGDPVSLFSGYFDGRIPSVARSGDDLVHDLTYALGIGPSARAGANITHGYEDQIAAYPGDTAGRHVQSLIKKAVKPPKWPAR